MTKRILITLILLLFSLVFIAGCKEGTGILGAVEEEEKIVVTSKEISIPMESVRTLNPIVSKDEESYYLNKLIYQGLFELDDTLIPVGVLAKDYTYGEDGISLTVTLKDDVLWQDGVTFSADDVKFSIDAYLSVLKTEKSLYGTYVSNIRSAKVLNDTTILITFQNANNVAIENLTFPIIPHHLFKKVSDVQKNVNNFIPIGTGPYMVDSIERGKSIVLKGNPNFKGDIPSNTILIKIIPGKEEAINLFEIGEIHLSFLKDTDRDTLLKNKMVNVISFPSNEVELLGFNFRHGALKDKRVRRAIAYAVNNEAIIETCYYGSGVLNDSIYYPNYYGIPSRKPLYEYDPDTAKLLLKNAGYEGLSLNLLVNGDNNARNLAAQMVKTGLEKLGITVTLTALQWDDYNKALASGDFDLYIGGYKINDTYDMRPVLHSLSKNPINYSNPTLDDLLDQMQSSMSTDKKRATFEKVHKIITDEIPYYCLLYKTYGLAVSNDLKGNIDPRFNNIYHGCKNWSLVYEKTEK